MVETRSRPGSDDEPDDQPRERVNADELVARVIAQVPDPKRHLIPPALDRSDPPD